MGKWQERWAEGLRRVLSPDCAVTSTDSAERWGIIVIARLGEHKVGILLNPSSSPGCRQNRRLIREWEWQKFKYALKGKYLSGEVKNG